MKTTTEMQLVPIAKLVPYVNNARTHSPEQITKLRSSLREFGFINPVIIDRDFNVIAGHGRILAAKEEGITEVPCVFADHLSEAQKKAYIIADNRMAMDAGWDEELLRVEIESLQGMDFDPLLTGFDEKELAALFDAGIEAGDVRVSDMFNLYKYENQICVLRMTGKEIHDYLEMSYALWTNRMTSPTDHIMLLERDEHGGYGFKNLAFNFDSAAGIDYEVDVTQPEGRKVKIIRMSDGRPFDETAWYDVAMNSYRGNGGGELLTKGAGIPHDSLKGRTAYESERDQRYYLMKEIEAAGTMDPQPNSNWRFVPDNWTRQAIIRDKELLFGGKNKTMKQQR